MQYGTVKMWDAGKGYGFIISDEDRDLFVHVSDLDVRVKEKRLREGQRVGFDVKRDIKGDKAIRVRVMD